MSWIDRPQKPGWYVGAYRDDGYMVLVHFHYATKSSEEGVKPGDFCYGTNPDKDTFPATDEWLKLKRFQKIMEPPHA